MSLFDEYDELEGWSIGRVLRTVLWILIGVAAMLLVPLLMDAAFGALGVALYWMGGILR